MDSWDATYGVKKLDEGTYSDDFHTFGLYWDEHELVRGERQKYDKTKQRNVDRVPNTAHSTV